MDQNNVTVKRDTLGRFTSGCNIGKLNKGIKRSDEFKERISAARKGIKLSEKTKLKMSLGKIGNKNGIGNKSTLGMTGPKSNSWKNDRSQIVGRHERKFHSNEYKSWRKSVCNRDDWKCQMSDFNCKGRLEVHHILGWKQNPDVRYEVNNGITLCHFHHPRKRKDEMRLVPLFQEMVAKKCTLSQARKKRTDTLQ